MSHPNLLNCLAGLDSQQSTPKPTKEVLLHALHQRMHTITLLDCSSHVHQDWLIAAGSLHHQTESVAVAKGYCNFTFLSAAAMSSSSAAAAHHADLRPRLLVWSPLGRQPCCFRLPMPLDVTVWPLSCRSFTGKLRRHLPAHVWQT